MRSARGLSARELVQGPSPLPAPLQVGEEASSSIPACFELLLHTLVGVQEKSQGSNFTAIPGPPSGTSGVPSLVRG